VGSWASLYQAHQAIRGRGLTWTHEVRTRLTRLANAGHCEDTVGARFTNKRIGTVDEWSIRPRRGVAAEDLLNIDGLRRATLTIAATMARRGHLHQFDVRAEGERLDGTPWVIAVHLSDDRGPDGDRHALGAGGHAALHCHVGPDLNASPKIRVPLPDLGPVEALEWVLSQLVPTAQFEPAPWSEVQAALKKASP
jgi:hypothetical protein